MATHLEAEGREVQREQRDPDGDGERQREALEERLEAGDGEENEADPGLTREQHRAHQTRVLRRGNETMSRRDSNTLQLGVGPMLGS